MTASWSSVSLLYELTTSRFSPSSDSYIGSNDAYLCAVSQIVLDLLPIIRELVQYDKQLATIPTRIILLSPRVAQPAKRQTVKMTSK